MHPFITRISKRQGLPLLAAPAAGVALLAAACGSAGVTGPANGGYGSGTGTVSGRTAAGGNPYGTAPAPVSAGAVSINVGMSGLGSFLTDAQGRTVYLFTRDSGNTPSCTGACTSVWPPVTSSTMAKVGPGASESLLSTVGNAGGQQQVTYNGHPLYYYAGDVNRGDTNGEQLDQFGGLWYVVSPSGMQVSQ
jgi:predicted lipoprotein with Yx(FWY)xxD motif